MSMLMTHNEQNLYKNEGNLEATVVGTVSLHGQ